jgi:pimeloyl-ACP methyl ester carboxylesterase
VSVLARIAEVEEHAEHSFLGTRNVPGVLVQVSPGSPGDGVGVSVHGINARCSDVNPLTLELVERGAVTLAIAYDDDYRRLRDSAADLAAALRPYLESRPGEPLFVRAHSMGSRIVLVALERLGREGLLGGRDIDVALVAPPLGGYRSADLARVTPWPLSRLKYVQPGIDMGRDSRFQRRLQALSLPVNVRVRVFLATNDRIVDSGDRGLWQVVRRVRGEAIWLPGATHESALGAAADWLRAERARVAAAAKVLPLVRRLDGVRR